MFTNIKIHLKIVSNLWIILYSQISSKIMKSNTINFIILGLAVLKKDQ